MKGHPVLLNRDLGYKLFNLRWLKEKLSSFTL
jgi:hypothetical protein